MIYSIRGICGEEAKRITGLSDPNLDYKIISGDFWEVKENAYQKDALFFKNCVETQNMDEIEKRLTSLKGLKDEDGFDIPWMVDGLEKIAEAKIAGRKIGISGGPCLFGEHEVDVEVFMKDGSVSHFDYSTGKNYIAEHDFCNTTNDLTDYLIENKENVNDIQFSDNKEGITKQEYYSIKYLFDIGQKLGAVVVIPLPDMSYIKYLRYTMEEFEDRTFAERVVNDFKKIAYRISDLYIDFTKELSKKYPNVEYIIVHERDSKNLEKYYSVREPYYQKRALMRTITGIPQKTESVKDYISMPALPFFLYGITDVLQCDSLDETDSFRKCRKAVKGAVNLACMLYPEKISADGENTIFHADKEYKEYLTSEDYE